MLALVRYFVPLTWTSLGYFMSASGSKIPEVPSLRYACKDMLLLSKICCFCYFCYCNVSCVSTLASGKLLLLKAFGIFFGILGIYLGFWDFLRIFWDFLGFLGFFGIFFPFFGIFGNFWDFFLKSVGDFFQSYLPLRR